MAGLIWPFSSAAEGGDGDGWGGAERRRAGRDTVARYLTTYEVLSTLYD
jgi:hypothetical protein